MAKALGSLVLLLQADTKRLEKDLGKANSKLKKFEGSAASSAKRISSSLKSITLGLGAGASIGAAFNRINKDLVNFGSAISDLSAITGATGKDLDFLTEAAREFGATTTLSATEAAVALKLIGSAKPDLLESGKALKAVTKEAIALSEASGVSLPIAAATLGGALNQMAEGADQAGRFVNVLAAGSKAGASEVSEAAQALKVAGLEARLAGLSFEESNAAIQLLSVNLLKGSEAGTALRAIYIALTTKAESQFNPAIVGMSQALKNLSDANLTATEKVALFGAEAKAASTILIEGRHDFDKLAAAVTGTSVVYDQQRIRNNNLEGDYKKLKSATEDLSLEIGESLNQSFRDSAQLSTEVVSNVSGMIDKFKELAVESGFAGDEIDGMLKLDLVDWGVAASRSIALVADSLNSLAQIANIARLSLIALTVKSSRLSLILLSKFGKNKETFAALLASQADDAVNSVDNLGKAVDKLITGPTFASALEANLNATPGDAAATTSGGGDGAADAAARLDAARAKARADAARSASAGAAKTKLNASAGIVQGLRDELALSQAITDEQKFQVELTQGKFRDLVGGDAALGRQLAIQIRTSEAAAEARQVQEEQDRARAELAAGAIADLERQVATHGLVTEAAKIRFELEEGSYRGLDAQSKARILSLSKELEAMENATIAADELKQAQEDAAAKAAQTAAEFGNVFSSAFEDAIVSGGKLSDILKGIEQDLIRLIVRKSITVPLQNAIGGLFGGSGDVLGGIGSFFGGFRAAGGPVQSGKAFLVGEQGPELFVPQAAGQIVPNNQTGGGAVNLTLNVNGVTDADSFNRSRNQVLATLQSGLAASRSRG